MRIVFIMVILSFLVSCQKEQKETEYPVTYTCFSRKGVIDFHYPNIDGTWTNIKLNQNNVVVYGKYVQSLHNLSPTFYGTGIDSLNLKMEVKGQTFQSHAYSSDANSTIQIFVSFNSIK